MVLTINNFSCLEQWKRIIELLFTCKRAVATRSDLFISAIAALRLQLQHCKDAEGGLIDLADESGSLLKGLLVRFRRGIQSMSGIELQDVIDELDDLEEYLKQEHGWQFGGSFVKTGLLELEDGEQVRMDTTAFDEDDETGEFAPQVVELTPQQAKMLNIQDTGDLPTSMSRASLKDVETDDEEDESDAESAASGESEAAGDIEDMDARF
jgi:A1 cistron-splicing factor AAR2